MEIFSRLIESFDLRVLHAILCLTGVLGCVYVMQLFGTHQIGGPSISPVLESARRVMLACIGLSFLWMLSFALDKGWQPWPPMLLTIAAIDGFTILTAIIAYKRAAMEEAEEDERPYSAAIRRESLDGRLHARRVAR